VIVHNEHNASQEITQRTRTTIEKRKQNTKKHKFVQTGSATKKIKLQGKL